MILNISRAKIIQNIDLGSICVAAFVSVALFVVSAGTAGARQAVKHGSSNES